MNDGIPGFDELPGFDGGDDFVADPTDTAPPAGGQPDGGLLGGLLDGAGSTIGKAEISAKLIFATGMLNDFAGERMLADLTMTHREADLVASGLAAWSKRAPIVGQLMRPSPTMSFAIGWGSYGYRVWTQRNFNLAMADMPAGAGAVELTAFQPPSAAAPEPYIPDQAPPADDGGIQPYNPMGT